jgi:hypothetical protein
MQKDIYNFPQVNSNPSQIYMVHAQMQKDIYNFPQVNSNPAFYMDTQVQKDIIPGVLREAIDIAEMAHVRTIII